MFRKNKVPWIVGAVLAVALVVGVLVATGGKSKSKAPPPPPESARALVMPANRARTVVVPPCNTPVADTERAARRGEAAPGATQLQVPRGRGLRTVMVPHCQPDTGSTTLSGDVPSAAFVAGGERRLGKDAQGNLIVGGAVAKSQLVLPDDSQATTIVMPACDKKTGEKDEVLSQEQAGSGLVTAPSC
jgi:hypothetical protein